MSIQLRAMWARCAVGAAFVLCAGLYSYGALQVWRASRWEASSSADLWLRATVLEPWDAAYWNKLGLDASLNPEHSDAAAAARFFARATALNAHAAESWMSLAVAQEALGEIPAAAAAFGKAQAAYPVSAAVAWRYGNFLVRQENFSEAAAQFRRALEGDESLSENVVSEWQRAGRSTDELVNRVLPPLREPYVTAISFFLREGQIDAAVLAWNGLLRAHRPFQMDNSFTLIKALIDAGRVDEAVRVWQQDLAATGWPDDPRPAGSLVFNGGFERDCLSSGFDWELLPMAGASFDYDTAILHSGLRALRIRFDGSSNVDFRHVLEFIRVAPHTRYRLGAFLRTEELSTDSGVLFEITDYAHPGVVLASTSAVLGSTPWLPVAADFSTGDEMQLLTITLRRVPSSRIDAKLRGTVWLDDVTLIPLGPGSKAAQ